MYEIEYTNSFKKDYKRILKRGYDINLLMELFEQLIAHGNVNAVYKPHKLLGKYTGYWECHIQADWLLIWEINEQKRCVVLHYSIFPIARRASIMNTLRAIGSHKRIIFY